RNHPRFGVTFRSTQEWDDLTEEIAQQLDVYGRSLKDFEASHSAILNDTSGGAGEYGSHNETGTPSVRSVNTNASRMTESDIQTKIVVAYGTHVMHVLHILLTG